MSLDPKKAAVLIVDLQNDFLDPKGAYGRAGQTSPEIAALPSRVLPLLNTIRKAGGWVISTQFTLVPGKAGEPFISQHLKRLRPFLGKGDFAPASWGKRAFSNGRQQTSCWIWAEYRWIGPSGQITLLK